MGVTASGAGRAHSSMPSPTLSWLLESVGVVHLITKNGLWASEGMGKPGLLGPWLQRHENGKKPSLATKETPCAEEEYSLENWTALPVTLQSGPSLGIPGPGFPSSASSPDVNLLCLWGH